MTWCSACGMSSMSGGCSHRDCPIRATSMHMIPDNSSRVEEARVVGPRGIARAAVSSWRYDWGECPFGDKMLLLTEGNVAVIGHADRRHGGYKAWAPLPDRDKEAEKRLGIL